MKTRDFFLMGVIAVLCFLQPRLIRAQASASLDPADMIDKADPELDFGSGKGAESTRLSPKIFARMSGGMISNVGTSSGSTFTYGGANVGGLFFILEQVSLGLAYKIESTFVSIPLKGIDIFTRYYFLGSGTLQTTHDSYGNSMTRHRQYSPYLGAEFSNRDFSLELDPTAADPADQRLSGTLSTFNVMAGIDYRLNSHWEATAELSMTLIPFGGTDSRVKIKWFLVALGANYVF